ncbi:MAG: putative adenine-specific methylase [Prokaryotic dsDNA virus sp.]|nr:MAG: putative adenine-specific methylase [Prokaryotic dsDNA virus sp.]|tara:strand:- start:15474 stop:15974 length:501 start_codon:yes stop_codon:yes gene_type:complete
MSVNKGLFSSNKDDWRTPKWLFNALHNHFKFDLDVCSDEKNALLPKYYTKENSCLNKNWETCNFMNPPYGREINKFVKKAYEQWGINCTIVALLPARTDTKWFHNYIYNKASMVFIKGRIKFEGGEKLAPAPFPSMIVIWWGMKKINDKDFLSEENILKLINGAKI